MKTKISIISLLLIFIMPIHSIAWDTGVSIKLEGAKSGLFTVTKLKDLGYLSLFISSKCYRMSGVIVSKFDKETKTVANSMEYCSCYNSDDTVVEVSGSDDCENVQLLSNNLMVEYLIESDSESPITISSSSHEWHTLVDDMFSISSSMDLDTKVCFDEQGKNIASGEKDLTLKFDSYNKAYCYLYSAQRMDIDLLYISEKLDYDTVINLPLSVTFSY